jgi:hypothetical protein
MGLSAQRIYQDLVCEQGFVGIYLTQAAPRTKEVPFPAPESPVIGSSCSIMSAISEELASRKGTSGDSQPANVRAGPRGGGADKKAGTPLQCPALHI